MPDLVCPTQCDENAQANLIKLQVLAIKANDYNRCCYNVVNSISNTVACCASPELLNNI